MSANIENFSNRAQFKIALSAFFDNYKISQITF